MVNNKNVSSPHDVRNGDKLRIIVCTPLVFGFEAGRSKSLPIKFEPKIIYLWDLTSSFLHAYSDETHSSPIKFEPGVIYLWDWTFSLACVCDPRLTND